MGGIAGAIGTADSRLIREMSGALCPDGRAARYQYWSWQSTHLAASSFNVAQPDIDLHASDTPRRISVAFDGAIYNARDLRPDIATPGYTVRDDAAVVNGLYQQHGALCVRLLRGMFAFAILDGNHLLLARDQVGIRPLYYTMLREHGLFLFASEIKALLQCAHFKPRLDMQAFADFIVLGHPVGTATFFEGVRSVPPGHTITINCEHAIEVHEPARYWTRNTRRNANLAFEEATRILENVLAAAIESHIANAETIALALSGGLDSTVLALLIHRFRPRTLMTFCAAADAQHPDIVQAGTVAATIGSRHFPIVIDFDQYASAIPACVAADEQPGSLYSVPFYLLCRKISEHANICLVGEGADALLGGNDEYLNREFALHLAEVLHRLPVLKQAGLRLSDRAAAIIEGIASSGSHNKYLERLIDFRITDSLERYHLELLDRCGRAAGVEMRLPYLDDQVVGFVDSVPISYLVNPDLGITKYLFRHFSYQRFGDSIVDMLLRQKLGIPAAGLELHQRFDRLCEEMLADDYLKNHELGFYFATKRQITDV